MSKLCSKLFKVSDSVSGGILVVSIIVALLAFIVPPVALVVTAIMLGSNLGSWPLFYIIAFLTFTYLTYRHNFVSVFCHLALILLLLFSGSIPYLYIVLFLVFLMPYITIYREAIHNKQINKD
jgi:uncharacterized membrane protein